jgi:prevent-host-death family protein
MKTATVGIREAKIHLSKYLKIVGQGGEVIITDRGVPVGRIVPLPPAARSFSQRLNKLEKEGLIGRRPTTRKTGQLFPLAVPDGIAQQLLREDREDG